MKKLFTLLFAAVQVFSFAQDKKAYQIFNDKGEKVTYQQMVDDLSDEDVVLFGEYHNNPIIHWLQLELTIDLYEKHNDNLVLGAEMFESDDQVRIDEYLNGIVNEKNFEQEAKLWPNYTTDYKPLMVFAKENGLDFIATNTPRRYANIVYREGFEGLKELSKRGKSYIAPQPQKYDPELGCYKTMLEMMGGHGGENLPKAQALKDATMAHFIVENVKKDGLFLHYNGAYHSDNHESIEWYIGEYNKKLTVKTISVASSDNLDTVDEELMNQGNYIIVVDEDMTTTH